MLFWLNKMLCSIAKMLTLLYFKLFHVSASEQGSSRYVLTVLLLCCLCCSSATQKGKVNYFVSSVLYLIHSEEEANWHLWWPVCISPISVLPPYSG